MRENPKTILLTGYEPFDSFSYNPSGALTEVLDGQMIEGYVVKGAVMPVDCVQMPGVLYGLVEQHQPLIVVGMGLAFGDSGLCVERVGHNWSEINSPDNGGHTRPGVPLEPAAPTAYFSTFPASQIVSDLLEAGIPAYPSDHAGGHLCNEMLFTALHAVNSGAWPPVEGRAIAVGFVHLPGTPQLAARMIQQDKHFRHTASMDLELMRQGLELALAATVRSLK